MSKPNTRFLANQNLWQEIQSRVKGAKHVSAAIAYLGQGGSKILRLKKGDRLVVDMSPGAVRQGVTDPREVRRLLKRGVTVFTRPRLHAKFVVADQVLIAGSANVSHRSLNALDEVGIITGDTAAIRRAGSFFDQLCTEPVRQKYLAECIKMYRPPKFGGVRQGSKKGSVGPLPQARVWFLGGLRQVNPRGEDAKLLEKMETRAARKLRQPERTCVSWVRYGGKPRFLQAIRSGDWVVRCTTDGGPRYLQAPAQVLYPERWASFRGTKYQMLMLEVPAEGAHMPLSQFRRKIKRAEPSLDSSNPRTKPIVNDETADTILRLWTANGHISKRH